MANQNGEGNRVREPLPWWKRWMSRAAYAIDYHKKLYRYRPFNAEKDLNPTERGYLLDVLTTGRIFAPAAHMLNDPWEVSPRLVYWPFSDRHVQFATYLAHLSDTSQEEYGRLLKEVRKYPTETLSTRATETLVRGLQRCPIVSLAVRPDNFLMWSYYASGHCGYLLEFDCTMPPMAAAVRVGYKSRQPVVPIWSPDRYGNAVSFYTRKAKQWSHEQEWRFIGPSMVKGKLGITDIADGPKGGTYFTLRRDALTGVVLGDRLFHSDHGQTAVHKIREVRPDIHLRVARNNKTRYAIDIHDL